MKKNPTETKEQKYRRELEIPIDKEPFEFKYTEPCLDWYEIKKVIINPTDYYYFELERRFGPSWHLIGMNPIDEYPYWEKKELGKIGQYGNYDLKRFIKWAKTNHGSRITNISAICGSFDILEEIRKIMEGEQGESK